MKRELVVLLTDFGLKDHYVGVMKGVILSRAPWAKFVDLTHEIPPQNILEAAYCLFVSYPYFPEETVFVTVVDPGVGTSRKAVILLLENRLFVGPDNGVFSLLLTKKEPQKAYYIENDEFFLKPTSYTFHGRDVFSPVAAELLKGRSPEDFGPEASTLVRLPIPPPVSVAEGLKVSVLKVDRFGNLILNISQEELHELPKEVLVNRRKVRFLRTYGEAEEGEPLCLVGSDGFLEVAVNKGSAEKLFGRNPEVILKWKS